VIVSFVARIDVHVVLHGFRPWNSSKFKICILWHTGQKDPTTLGMWVDCGTVWVSRYCASITSSSVITGVDYVMFSVMNMFYAW